MPLLVNLHSEYLKEYVLRLKHQDHIEVPESDYSFGEIHRMYDNFVVFLVPQYGGTPSFYKAYGLHAVDDMIRELRSMG